MNIHTDNITPILSRQNTWFQINGFGLVLMLVGIFAYVFISDFTLGGVAIIIAFGIVIIGLYNYEYNLTANFYDDYMTVEYNLGKRYKIIKYKTIEKAKFITTAKSGTWLSIVYLDNKYGRHEISILGPDKELMEFVETKLKPIVRTNNFIWTT